jgi:chromosome segregation ATPase
MSSNPQQPTYIIPPPSGANWKTPLLVTILLLLVASNVYLYIQVDRIRTDSRTEMAKLTADLNGAIEKMRIDSSEAIARAHHSVEELQARLEAERRAARTAVGEARIEAEQRVQALQSQLASEQQAIAAVKQATETATTQLQGVSTDVNNVKGDLQNTKSQLEQTIANLKRVRGDLDNDTSLIATNSKELEALKQLGERDYAQFTITKAKKPTRVADVLIELKKADPKHNRFTIVITADDKTVEKKDRTINEPIQFYTSKSRQPDEIVVNQVKKNTIIGYLAMPKVQIPRSGT